MQSTLLSSKVHPQLRSRCRRAPFRSRSIRCNAQHEAGSRKEEVAHGYSSRRDIVKIAPLASALVAAIAFAPEAQAFPGFKKDLNKKRRVKVPESEYKDLADGLKYYDVKVGDGLTAKVGSRVAVHYEARWRGVTFMTSRQGMGVTGGSPIGFDIGAPEQYGTLPGLDRGVRGMRVGGQRKLLVPPNLAYGDRGVGEIPGGATLEFDVELLSIKTSPLGSRVKIVEG